MKRLLNYFKSKTEAHQAKKEYYQSKTQVFEATKPQPIERFNKTEPLVVLGQDKNGKYNCYTCQFFADGTKSDVNNFKRMGVTLSVQDQQRVQKWNNQP